YQLADVLGGADTRAAVPRCRPWPEFLPDLNETADRCGGLHRRREFLVGAAAVLRHDGPDGDHLHHRAELLCAVETGIAWWCRSSAVVRAGQGRFRAVHPAVAILFGDLRCLCGGAAVPAVDIYQLDDFPRRRGAGAQPGDLRGTPQAEPAPAVLVAPARGAARKAAAGH